MAKKYAVKILFTTAEGQVVCNYVFVEGNELVNIPVGEFALTQQFDEMISEQIFAPHPDVLEHIIPTERPDDFLKSMPYIFNGSYYRATFPEMVEI